MTAYETAEWHDFFLASAGAAAALAGLVFVAVSINIARILDRAGQPERALQTVLLLLAAVVTSLLALVPQGRGALGTELLVTGLAFLAFFAGTAPVIFRQTRSHPVWLLTRLVTMIPGHLFHVVAGVSLLAGAGGGLYWLAAALVTATVGAVANAWVLLVEILR